MFVAHLFLKNVSQRVLNVDDMFGIERRHVDNEDDTKYTRKINTEKVTQFINL